MSGFPEQLPDEDFEIALSGAGEADGGPPAAACAPVGPAPEAQTELPGSPHGAEPGAYGTPLFASYQRFAVRPPTRSPNMADLGIAMLLVFFGWLGSGGLLLIALHFHLFGVSTIKQAINDIHYTLGSQAIWYLVSFSGCLLLFPMLWHKSFFAGVEWRIAAAMRMRRRLVSAAFICFVLAMIDGILMPGPSDTPIDQVFRMPGAAWLLFAFGVTLAPFFEELAFRGFLLPALCTAYDWLVEQMRHQPAPWPDPNGKTLWSLPAMAAASLVTSIPFALMHAEQTGYSLGPFLLLVCVSLVLCWIRLSTRSLAASVAVHSCYNLLLFSLMLAGTGGFKHFERM